MDEKWNKMIGQREVIPKKVLISVVVHNGTCRFLHLARSLSKHIVIHVLAKRFEKVVDYTSLLWIKCIFFVSSTL